MGRQKDAQAAKAGRLLGKNLVTFREKRDLSQTATAERAGLHRTEVSLIERGQRVPRLDTIVKLAGAVEVDPCALLKGMAWRLDPKKNGGSK
jgi:transcriptional regulator with XRE-family HTH domain